MGTIKDRNGMDLTEAEDIKKRWQEYTEELYKKDLNDLSENHNGVIMCMAAGTRFDATEITPRAPSARAGSVSSSQPL